jgi:hypothetical protein
LSSNIPIFFVTIGNVFDPGTWRIDSPQSIGGTAVCVINGVALVSGNSNMTLAQLAKQCASMVRTHDSSAWNGWTPERSRCNSRSGRIRVRLISIARLSKLTRLCLIL